MKDTYYPTWTALIIQNLQSPILLGASLIGKKLLCEGDGLPVSSN